MQLLSYKNIIESFLNFTGHEVIRWVKKHPMKTMNDPDEVVSCTSVTEVLTSSDFSPWKLCLWTDLDLDLSITYHHTFFLLFSLLSPAWTDSEPVRNAPTFLLVSRHPYI